MFDRENNDGDTEFSWVFRDFQQESPTRRDLDPDLQAYQFAT